MMAIAHAQKGTIRAKSCRPTNVATTSLVRAISPAPAPKFATNTPARNQERGVVFAIVDREETQFGIKYLVKWCDEADGFRWDDTWEYGVGLREDGFDRACNVVDEWKMSKVSTYYRFCKLNGHCHHIGASPKGLCAFYALGIATELVGNAGWHSMAQARQFMRECAGRGKPISPEGVTYGELRCYVKFANSRNLKQVSTKLLDKNVFGGVTGHQSTSKLCAVVLDEGVYICAAFSSLRVTHSFVIAVVHGKKFIYDDAITGVGIEQCDLSWIYGVSFVRRVDNYVP
ncbi:hypothetical protein PF008_g16744 [Phytophthora fragariae]|uniref:Chromo domain-containing protein n=1 Tax=Phytophthora fragariae TaxID=53985 RepID=A0A6G0RA89_9STRA|nr:hypothetical protein PF008_g16744 [Phytophthora fragariae]